MGSPHHHSPPTMDYGDSRSLTDRLTNINVAMSWIKGELADLKDSDRSLMDIFKHLQGDVAELTDICKDLAIKRTSQRYSSEWSNRYSTDSIIEVDHNQPTVSAGFKEIGYSQPTVSAGFKEIGYSQPAVSTGFKEIGYSQPAVSAGFKETGYSQRAVSAGFKEIGYSQPAVSAGFKEIGYSQPTVSAGFKETGYSQPAVSAGLKEIGYSQPAVSTASIESPHSDSGSLQLDFESTLESSTSSIEEVSPAPVQRKPSPQAWPKKAAVQEAVAVKPTKKGTQSHSDRRRNYQPKPVDDSGFVHAEAKRSGSYNSGSDSFLGPGDSPTGVSKVVDSHSLKTSSSLTKLTNSPSITRLQETVSNISRNSSIDSGIQFASESEQNGAVAGSGFASEPEQNGAVAGAGCTSEPEQNGAVGGSGFADEVLGLLANIQGSSWFDNPS